MVNVGGYRALNVSFSRCFQRPSCICRRSGESKIIDGLHPGLCPDGVICERFGVFAQATAVQLLECLDRPSMKRFPTVL
jgi:hypothetical protein